MRTYYIALTWSKKPLMRKKMMIGGIISQTMFIKREIMERATLSLYLKPKQDWTIPQITRGKNRRTHIVTASELIKTPTNKKRM